VPCYFLVLLWVFCSVTATARRMLMFIWRAITDTMRR
jgi:hypothetical protein